MNRKGICKNCGDDISDDSNSNEFCSEQCGVEYQMEHNKK
jgi:predicted nucleic acid-binding Zn ribbon protein